MSSLENPFCERLGSLYRSHFVWLFVFHLGFLKQISTQCKSACYICLCKMGGFALQKGLFWKSKRPVLKFNRSELNSEWRYVDSRAWRSEAVKGRILRSEKQLSGKQTWWLDGKRMNLGEWSKSVVNCGLQKVGQVEGRFRYNSRLKRLHNH